LCRPRVARIPRWRCHPRLVPGSLSLHGTLAATDFFTLECISLDPSRLAPFRMTLNGDISCGYGPPPFALVPKIHGSRMTVVAALDLHNTAYCHYLLYTNE